MAKAYTHSVVFDTVKATKEVISDNLTSLHYLQTLDMFLWRALEPIHAECPSLFNNYVAKVVAHQVLKSSTKFTSLSVDEKPALPLYLFNALTTANAQKGHEHVKALHMNRGLLFGFLSWFLSQVKAYEELHKPSDKDPIYLRSKMYQIERSLGVQHRASLYAIIQQVRYWDDKARWFKSIIMQKYHRLAINSAKKTYEDYNHYVPLDDVVQVYLMVLSRAIDRCDPRQGVLTTFITNWFKSARSEVATMAKGQSDTSFESLAEDYGDAASTIFGSVEFDTSSETVEHISWMTKRLDRCGYIRASLGIPEFLFPEQLETLERFAL